MQLRQSARTAIFIGLTAFIILLPQNLRAAPQPDVQPEVITDPAAEPEAVELPSQKEMAEIQKFRKLGEHLRLILKYSYRNIDAGSELFVLNDGTVMHAEIMNRQKTHMRAQKLQAEPLRLLRVYIDGTIGEPTYETDSMPETHDSMFGSLIVESNNMSDVGATSGREPSMLKKNLGFDTTLYLTYASAETVKGASQRVTRSRCVAGPHAGYVLDFVNSWVSNKIGIACVPRRPPPPKPSRP